MSDKQIVIVTGGAQGIGFGICRRFSHAGSTVIVADINESAAHEAASKLSDEGAAASEGIHCDVTDLESIERTLDTVIERYGHVDVLVNNAGICPFTHVMEMSSETWQRSVDVNLTAPYEFTQAFAKRLIDRGRPGRVIFITSLADTMTNPLQVDYAATKSGLRMLMAGFATALGPHQINCNAVAPGHVRTPLTEHGWGTPEGQAKIPHVIPLGRLGQPEDIGDACVYLASPQASYVNGITLRVDGGNSVLVN